MKWTLRERQKSSPRRFTVPSDATRELHESFNRWSKSLSQYGLQIAFALIAANWAIHGPRAIPENAFAKLSIAVAILYMTFYLVLLGLMVRLTRRQHSFANEEKGEWANQYKRAGEPLPPRSGGEHIWAQTRAAVRRWTEEVPTPDLRAWPYTPGIQTTGSWMRRAHVVGPVVSGVLLVASIWHGSEGGQSVVRSDEHALPSSCCLAIGGDVAAMRRSVDEYVRRLPPPPGIAASDPPSGEIIVSGQTDLELPGVGLIAVGLLLLAGGGGMLVLSQKSRIQAAGASLATIGVLSLSGGGFTLVKELKVDSIFSVKTDKLLELVRKETSGLGSRGPERIAEIQNFVLGAPNLIELAPTKSVAEVEKSPELARAAKRWIENRTAGRQGVILVIGGTDRLPLSGASERQFEANVGLAQARGEAVRNAFARAVADLAPEFTPRGDQVIVLVGGPSQTPADVGGQVKTDRRGYPQDRRVDIWALWAGKHEDASKR